VQAIKSYGWVAVLLHSFLTSVPVR
jgi:hypothetical protein